MERVYDCFTFFNELDLLEIRLNELSPVVDVFVIAEAPLTFQGDPKPLHFRENRRLFDQFASRIRHVVVDRMPPGESSRDNWRREHHQRNALATAIEDARADDLILLSDVDEIPRADSIRAAFAQKELLPTVHCFELAMFTFFVNCRQEEPWSRSGPRMTRRRNLGSMQGLRNVHPPTPNPLRSALRAVSASINMGRPVRRIVHRDAGWHFSSMGGVDRVAQKLSAFSHIVEERAQNPDATMAQIAANRMLQAESDPSIRQVPIDATFPRYLAANQERSAHLTAGSRLPDAVARRADE
jgi:beta-1,4-mannosyl-glycoprotein beta-1,4-N-acetylglucosaminyltransferase